MPGLELQIDDILEKEVMCKRVAQRAIELASHREIGGIIGEADGQRSRTIMNKKDAGSPGKDEVAVLCFSHAVNPRLGLGVRG